MIALVSSTFLTLFLCFNFGLFFAKKLNISIDFIGNFLIGLVFINTITSCISIFYPINLSVLISELVVGLLLSITNFKEIKAVLQSLNNQKYILVISAPFLIWGFVNSLVEPLNPDSSLYHLQSIKWIEEYAVVPGLGNLHGRFGFNPNVFTMYALTSLSEVFSQEIFSINFTLFVIFVVYFIKKGFEYFLKDGFSNLFLLNIFLLVNVLSLVFSLSSPTPDFISIGLPIFVFAKIINENYSLENLDFKHFAFIVIVAAYSVTVKLATFPLFILPLSILFFIRFPAKKLAFLAVLSSLILAPWLIRNVIISGWLVYPFPSVDLFDFDWKVPITKVINEKELIVGFARNGGKHMVEVSKLPVNEWIKLWWQGIYTYEKPIIILSFFLPVFNIIFIFLKKIKIKSINLLILITSYLGLIIWFFLAPDFRFGKAFILFSALSPLYIFQNNILKINPISKNKRRVFSWLIIVLFVLAIFKSNFFTIKNTVKLTERIIRPEEMKTPIGIDFKATPVGNINIFYPKIDDECYNHPLPCGAYDYDKIEMRGINISNGFVAK